MKKTITEWNNLLVPGCYALCHILVFMCFWLTTSDPWIGFKANIVFLVLNLIHYYAKTKNVSIPKFLIFALKREKAGLFLICLLTCILLYCFRMMYNILLEFPNEYIGEGSGDLFRNVIVTYSGKKITVGHAWKVLESTILVTISYFLVQGINKVYRDIYFSFRNRYQ
jgi:hypothetical protein